MGGRPYSLRDPFPAIRLCPALTYLRLILSEEIMPGTPAPAPGSLPALVKLDIEGAPAPDTVRWLCVAAPRLEELKVEGSMSRGFTDEAVLAALAQGGLRELRLVGPRTRRRLCKSRDFNKIVFVILIF